MKEINLIPSYAAFDYKKYIVIQISKFVLTLNIITLAIVYIISLYANSRIENIIKKRENYLMSISSINKTFARYKKEYVKTKEELKKLNKEIDYYKRLRTIHRSAFTDSVIFINTFIQGVTFRKVDYRGGGFAVEGKAENKTLFQRFFKALESNPYIKDVRFYSLKRDKNGEYNFKVFCRVDLKW